MKILLDYYFYYDMYKTNVLSKAQHHIEKVTNLQKDLADSRAKDEQKQQEIQDLKKTIETLQKDLLNNRTIMEKAKDEKNVLKQKHFEIKNRVALQSSVLANLEHQDVCYTEKRNLEAEIKELEL